MKKILIGTLGSLLLSTSLYSATAIDYIQNFNKSVIIKDLVKKIDNINNSIGMYIVNTGGNPTYSSSFDKLSFNDILSNREAMFAYSNLDADSMTKIDGTPCSPAASNPKICANSDTDGISYSIRYDSSGRIPIGIEFTKEQILGGTNLTIDDKLIAYLNTKGLVYKDDKFVKYFSDKTISMIKQEYYIKKENPNIKFSDITLSSPSAFNTSDVIYSPDGKGGFLIYMVQIDGSGNKFWQVIGEPQIALTVDSVDDLENVKLSIGEDITVLDEGGFAIQYTMQDTQLDGEGNNAVTWNKNNGSFEKNYYFSPIKIGSISLGVSAELGAATGNWDGHTFLRDTYIDTILYDPIWEINKDKYGNVKLATSDYTITYGTTPIQTINVYAGEPEVAVDAGGNPIMKAQTINTILGHVKYDGGLATGGKDYTYYGKWHSSNIFTNQGGRLYYEIMAHEMAQGGLVNWIGHSHNENISGNDREAYYPCPASFNGGPIVYACDVWISHNKLTSMQGTWINKYKGSELKIYKMQEPNEFALSHKGNYDYWKNQYNNCILNPYANCSYELNQKNKYYSYYGCYESGTCNTSFACHHNTSECMAMDKNNVVSALDSSEFNMSLGCYEGARITYLRDDGKMVLLPEGQEMKVNVLPLNNRAAVSQHVLTYDLDGDGYYGYNRTTGQSKDSGDDSFITDEFDLKTITATTFGGLSCIKRNAASDYGSN